MIPAALAESLGETELRLVLAHEIAHLRRGDLLLGIVPALASIFLRFVPGIGLAIREWEAAREEDCDSLALQAAGGDPATYGRLLLRILERARLLAAGPPPAGPAAAPGMGSPGIAPLRRRLLALPGHLRGVRAGGGRGRFRETAAAGTAAVAVLLPWRLSLVAAAASTSGWHPKSSPDTISPDTLPHYDVIDLGTLGGSTSWAGGIDETGDVAGASNISPRSIRGHAFVAVRGALADLGSPLDYRHSAAVTVAPSPDNGGIAAAGWAYNRASRPVPLLWSGHGAAPRPLPMPGSGPWRWAQAVALDSRGNIAGIGRASSGDNSGAARTSALFWRGAANSPAKPEILASLGGRSAAALALSANGAFVAGKAGSTTDVSMLRPLLAGQAVQETHAVRWDTATGRPCDLGTLEFGSNSAANSINSHGTAAGFSETGEIVAEDCPISSHAFVRPLNASEPRDLGALSDVASSTAWAISERGVIAGASTVGASKSGRADDPRQTRAVLWLPQPHPGADSPDYTAPIDLNRLIPPGSGWTLAVARGINSRGQIVGQGIRGGKLRAFLLEPVRR